MIDVRHEKDKRRAAAYDGGREVGECTYVVNDGVWTIHHTGVDASYQGQGIARQLVDRVATEARSADVKLKATCSYAKAVLERGAQYADLLA